MHVFFFFFVCVSCFLFFFSLCEKTSCGTREFVNSSHFCARYFNILCWVLFLSFDSIIKNSSAYLHLVKPVCFCCSFFTFFFLYFVFFFLIAFSISIDSFHLLITTHNDRCLCCFWSSWVTFTPFLNLLSCAPFIIITACFACVTSLAHRQKGRKGTAKALLYSTPLLCVCVSPCFNTVLDLI